MVARILACVVALLLGSLALGWLFDPSTAAANLGVPLLDSIGRGTQVGDLTAPVVSGTALCLIPAIRQTIPNDGAINSRYCGKMGPLSAAL